MSYYIALHCIALH